MKSAYPGGAQAAIRDAALDGSAGDTSLVAAVGSAAETHRLVFAYVVFAGVALLFPERPASWALLLFVHGVGAALALWAGTRPGGFEDAPAAAAPRGRLWAVVAYLSAGYPLLLVPFLYGELQILNRAVHGGRYFDDVVLAWESLLFRTQPSQALAPALPSLWLSELLHASYLAYYLVIYAPPLLLLVHDRFREFREAVFTVMLVFFVHYLFFIYFPVQGPRYLAPPPVPAEAQGWAHALAHWVLERGSSQGAAFPSSHAAVSVAQVVVAARFLPRWAPLLAAITLGLSVGAVYGGFHYGTDMIVGLTLGTAVAYRAPSIAAFAFGSRGRERS